MTNEQHNKYIAYTFLGHAGFQLLMLLFMAAIFSFMLFIPEEPGAKLPGGFFAIMIAFFSVFYLAFTLPSVVAAYALLKRKPWARIASIVAGVVSAMNVPIGTAACVYALWFFLGDNWKEVYPDNLAQSVENRRQISYGAESQQAAYEAEQRQEKAANRYEPPDWR
ncbi:MAG: hypothetical protein ACKVRN_08475 [Pyrinomonadaceae bacterium]